jgi:hypothetical protein
MRPAGLVLVVLAGCTTPKPAPVVANRAQPAPLTCSNDAVERLRSILLARWDATAMLLRCTAGQFRSAGYFIEAIVDGERRTGIVDPSGAELVPFADEPAGDPYAFIAGFRAADLDGDGEDEIIESWRRTPTHALQPDNWLVVRMVAGKRLLRIKGPYLSRYHPELGSCSGTWHLRRGAINVVIAVSAGIPPSDCLPAGNHRFELRGHALVDAR